MDGSYSLPSYREPILLNTSQGFIKSVEQSAEKLEALREEGLTLRYSWLLSATASRLHQSNSCPSFAPMRHCEHGTPPIYFVDGMAPHKY